MEKEQDLKKRTVLVVDDVKMNRDIFNKIFSDSYKVLMAENGKEAIQLMYQEFVDIVLLDIEMPVMNGYEVIQKMKRDPKLNRIPIVVTTGAVDKSERKAFELGADEFIPQPYDPYIIRKRVENLIEKYILQVEIYQNKALEAERANQSKTDFLSRISHDMRTPLNGILGLTNILKEKINDADAQQDLTELELSGHYLLNLINDTLDVSKIESGKMELHPTVCDGRTLFNNAVSMAKANMRTKNIHFHIYADDLPFTTLYLDVGRVEQIVMNILGNAAKFTPEGGNVDLTIMNQSVEENVITDEIIVQDNGTGISEEFLPHLFDPFSQEDATRTTSHQGTGLGMTITKQLLTLMGGKISVESEVGRGTRVSILLPMPIATEEQLEEWKKTHVINRQSESLQDKRLLLCEDHPLNTKIAKRLLESRGAIVEHAENGKIGVRMFASSAFGYYDAILMDIRMPVMDGLDAARAIRALPRRDARVVPIIAMTANAFDEDVQQTKNAGMDAHLGKPIQIDKLYGTLEALFSTNRNLRRKKVLVVDDISVNRAVISNALVSDFDVLEAENGQEALEILKENRGIDAIITDIQMPKMDGVELIRKVRSDNSYRHIAIIANTQFGDPEQEENLLALGANDFVYKPTTPKIVEIRVRNALHRI